MRSMQRIFCLLMLPRASSIVIEAKSSRCTVSAPLRTSTGPGKRPRACTVSCCTVVYLTFKGLHATNVAFWRVRPVKAVRHFAMVERRTRPNFHETSHEAAHFRLITGHVEHTDSDRVAGAKYSPQDSSTVGNGTVRSEAGFSFASYLFIRVGGCAREG